MLSITYSKSLIYLLNLQIFFKKIRIEGNIKTYGEKNKNKRQEKSNQFSIRMREMINLVENIIIFQG